MVGRAELHFTQNAKMTLFWKVYITIGKNAGGGVNSFLIRCYGTVPETHGISYKYLECESNVLKLLSNIFNSTKVL